MPRETKGSETYEVQVRENKKIELDSIIHFERDEAQLHL